MKLLQCLSVAVLALASLLACDFSLPTDLDVYDDEDWDDDYEPDCERDRYGWLGITNTRDYPIHIRLRRQDGQDELDFDVSPRSGKRVKLDSGTYRIYPTWDICLAIGTCNAFYGSLWIMPCETVVMEY